ncbi:unnamed protein product [Periconia digitata]|uniref:ZZ-type domain-containing protein n=1 Tax=Periconia digitata TaxID=1303443 RepID=A0A9W4UPR3_9PLEO|nr:unnamed protein product [Periconia digitata]
MTSPHTQTTMQHPDYDYMQQQQQQPDYIQPHYAAPSSPPTFIAELPAPPPPAPHTTTSPQQLNQDELLAHKLQQLEVEDARRSSMSLRGSWEGQRRSLGAATSQLDLRGGAAGGAGRGRLHSKSVSELRGPANISTSLSPRGSSIGNTPSTTNQQARPHSQSLSSTMPAYSPDSFSRPIGIETSDLPEVVVEDSSATWAPELSQLPEVVVGPHVVTGSGEVHKLPSPTTSPRPTPPKTPDNPSSISRYLEEHLQVPYPPQWALQPPVATFYGVTIRAPKSDSWLDTPQSQQWRTTRITRKPGKNVPPAFEFTFKSKGGTFRDPQYTWTMSHSTLTNKNKTHPYQLQPEWRYHLRMEPDHKIRKSEHVYPARSTAGFITTYVHATNYDSLRFVGPGGLLYKWVSHAPVTGLNGSRHDALRHALFVSHDGTSDPLYGHLVADHAYWDGFIDTTSPHPNTVCTSCSTAPITGLRYKCRTCLDDHNVCDPCRASKRSIKNTCVFTLVNLPDETLHIRSPRIDPALVVATLQVLKDWEFHTLRWERMASPRLFADSEALARKGALGRIRHWRREDLDRKGRWAEVGEVFGTVVKAREVEDGFGVDDVVAGGKEGKGVGKIVKDREGRGSLGSVGG